MACTAWACGRRGSLLCVGLYYWLRIWSANGFTNAERSAKRCVFAGVMEGANQFVGTRPFSSSNQFFTTTICGSIAGASPGSLSIKNRRPSEETSY